MCLCIQRLVYLDWKRKKKMVWHGSFDEAKMKNEQSQEQKKW